MDLPTYYNFSKYQFLDVLDALSFRVMIINHVQDAKPKGPDSPLSPLKKPRDTNEPTPLIALKVQDQISKEINRLIFQKDSEKVTALQEVIAQEMKKRRVKDKDHEGLTSVHHIAAEVTIR